MDELVRIEHKAVDALAKIESADDAGRAPGLASEVRVARRILRWPADRIESLDKTLKETADG